MPTKTTQEAKMALGSVRYEIVERELDEGVFSTVDEDGYSVVRVIEVDDLGFTIFSGAADPVVLDTHIVQDAYGFIARERECEALAAEAAEFGMGIYEYTCQPFGIEWQREQEERAGR